MIGCRKARAFWGVASCVLLICGAASAETTLVLYPTNPDHKSDGKVTGAIDGRPVSFEYQHTYHVSSIGQKDFKASYVRFAADGPVDVELTVNASVATAHLRTVGKDLPFTRSGSTFTFTLPGPGGYYLQLPDLNTAGRVTYTVFFFFDDLATYNAYQQAFVAAKNVTSYGVVSHPTLDQTSAVQAVLNSGGSIYFPPGIYRTGQLTINSGTTVYLGAGAVLKGTDNYNSSRYIYIYGKQNVRIAGLGTIDVNGHTPDNMLTKGHGVDLEASADVRFDDVVFRDSNSWMLHIRRSDRVNFDNLKLFSGKDGIDPDGARDVTIKRTVVQSVDDGFAVKSKFSGRSCERVTFRDCIVFSCASSLKIGTENYYGVVRDITWDRCDAVDADRGCILYTDGDSGTAPIANITWRNIRIFNFPWEFETGGAPFQFHNVSGVSISNLLLENITAYPTLHCSVYGSVGATFRNVIMNGSSSIASAGMTFEGVIWPDVTSQSRPVVFVEPSPRNQNEYGNGDEVTVTVQHPYGRPISQVELLVDGQSAGVCTAPPYAFTLSGLSLGEHSVQAEAADGDGATNATAPLRILVVYVPAPPVQITSGPSASQITQTSAAIDWTTDPAGNSVVEYGPTESYEMIAIDWDTVTEHSVALTDLEPGATYHYRVRTQASGYSDALSADQTFATQSVPGTLRNPGFEDGPVQTAWVRYGTFDSDGNTGIQTGPWFNMLPHSGAYFAGSAASWENKNGGFYQRVNSGIAPGQYWAFTAWVNTYNQGSSGPSDTNNRLGIDPSGGVDPESVNVVWSPRVSTQYQWQQVSVAAQAAGSALTVFIEAQQRAPVEWNLNAFDDCAISQLSPSNIPQALAMPDSATVIVADRVVTAGTADVGGAFYIEEPDRCAGILVASDRPVSRGDRVIVTGSLGVDEQGEREISAESVTVTQSGQPLPDPLFLMQRHLGGAACSSQTPGVWQGLGLYNVGLLVRCFGRVTARGADYFYIDDGSCIDDGSGNTGVRIDAAGLSIPIQTHASVTGISTMRMVGGRAVRAIRPRMESDIVEFW